MTAQRQRVEMDLNQEIYVRVFHLIITVGIFPNGIVRQTLVPFQHTILLILITSQFRAQGPIELTDPNAPSYSGGYIWVWIGLHKVGSCPFVCEARTANHGVVRYAAQSRERAISEIWHIVDIMVSIFQRQ